jgi:GntR family transcriptional regulator, transcriptional repressor for pyruvate dehydrogenase complex
MSEVEFSAVKPNRVFQSVLEQIEDAILNGSLKPGDKLPNERKLIESLSISRPTLREALRVLQQRGFIEIRLGVKGGAFVKKIGVQQASDGLNMLIKHGKVSLRCLYEFREGTEGVVAALATERASAEDIDQLEINLKTAQQLLVMDPPDFVKFWEAESHLHVMMAKLSGNIIYEWVLSAVQTKIHSYIHFLPKTLEKLKITVEEWKRIIYEMRRREVSKVRILASAHVCHYDPYIGEDKPDASDILIKL